MTASPRVVHRGVIPLAAGLAMLLLAACAGGGLDKYGQPGSSGVVLRIGSADPTDPELLAFVAAVARASDGSLSVQVDRLTYSGERAEAEARMAGDVRSGTLPVAYIPSRDWAEESPDWQAVQAPFGLTTTAGAAAFATSAEATGLLARADDAGVVGLAAVPGEAHRLLSREPVLSLADLNGLHVRITASTQAARMFTDLGALPVTGLTSSETRGGLAQRRVDAVEAAPGFAVPNQYQQEAPYISSFGLYPRFDLILVSRTTWDGLNASQQQALRSAAHDAATHAASQLAAREAAELTALCRRGAVIVRPNGDALIELSRRVEPVRPSLREAAARIRAVIEDTGITAANPAPAGCPVAGTAAQALRMHAQNSTAAPETTPGAFPVGTYTEYVPAEAWAEGGVTGPDFRTDITFTHHFTADGVYTVTQQPDYPDQGQLTARWVADGDRLTIEGTFPDGGKVKETVQWSYYQGVLHLKAVDVEDWASRVIYQQPWHRVS